MSDGKTAISICSTAALTFGTAAIVAASPPPDWPQWGRNPQHASSSPVLGQPLSAIVADIVYDPFAPQEVAEGDGGLLVHYPAPLLEGDARYDQYRLMVSSSARLA